MALSHARPTGRYDISAGLPPLLFFSSSPLQRSAGNQDLSAYWFVESLTPMNEHVVSTAIEITVLELSLNVSRPENHIFLKQMPPTFNKVP
jgi:hypothetical protein